MKSKKGNVGGVVAGGVAIIVVLVIAIIVGSVEDGIVFTQSLSSTIGTYIEPLALLAALTIAGGLAYKAMK